MLPGPLLAQRILIPCPNSHQIVLSVPQEVIHAQDQSSPASILDHLSSSPFSTVTVPSHAERTNGSVDRTLASDALELDFDIFANSGTMYFIRCYVQHTD